MSLRNSVQIKKHCLSKIKEEDIEHRGFLKPLQIALKTHKTQIMNPDSNLKPTSLPAGLKIAVKQSIKNNKYILKDIIPISDRNRETFDQLKNENKDNLLTMMKIPQGIQLAICVCMYSQDRKMLRSTLKGISQNISHLVCQQGLSPDQIGVFVFMDGIQKVDESVVAFFEDLQRGNNINLGSNIAPTLSMEEMARRSLTMSTQQINQIELKNVNNFLFDVKELQDRNQRRFQSVRGEYLEIQKLMKQIEVLKKNKKANYDDLPPRLRDIFVQVARKQWKKDNKEADEQAMKLEDSRILEQYASIPSKSKPLVMSTLVEGQLFCKEYIKSRQDLAYLVSYRQKIKHPLSFLGNRADKYKDKIYDQLEQEQLDQETYTIMNLFLCVKYKNSGKLSSHNWFFNGFCKELRPRYAVLLDVGLTPQKQALQKMYKYMHRNQRKPGATQGGVGGVCGYMSLKIERVDPSQQLQDEDHDCLTGIVNHFVDIQRTQQVQYHFAHLMDKPFESAFGFIHVLPGAFSAYNMQAIMDYDREDDKLLRQYFKSIDQKLANNKITQTRITIGSALSRTLFPDAINRCWIDIPPDSDQQMLYNQNIYLAEDRILCMGIHKKGFDMTYLPDAYAEVDPIKTVHGLLGQRKRWINGSFFAFQKVKKELKEHQDIQGKCELMLHIQILYLSMMNSLAYLAPALFAFTVHVAMQAFRADLLMLILSNVFGDNPNAQVYRAFVYTMDFIYVMLVGSMIFFSLHLANRNKRFIPYIYAVSTIFGIFGISVFVVLAVDVIRGLVDNSTFLINNKSLIQQIPGGLPVVDAMRWILIATMGSYAIPILFYVCMFKKMNILLEIIAGTFSFLYYAPTYLNILNIYSLCRIDDISWGTKGLDSGGSDKNKNLADSWKLIKMVHVAKYVFWNIVVGVVLLSLGSSYVPRFYITFAIVIMMAATMGIKITVAVGYLIYYKMKVCTCCVDRPPINTQQTSRIKKILKQYKGDILKEIQTNLDNMGKQYDKKGFAAIGGSFIMASRTVDIVRQSFKKHKQQIQSRSKFVKKVVHKIMEKNSVPIIEEQRPKQRKPAHYNISQPSQESFNSPNKHETSQDNFLGGLLGVGATGSKALSANSNESAAMLPPQNPGSSQKKSYKKGGK